MSLCRYVDLDHKALKQMQTPTGGGMMSQYPLGFAQWLQALAYALSKPREIAIVGDPDSADTQALLHVVRSSYRPFRVKALGAPSAQPPAVPLLQDRGLVNRHAAAYVCAVSRARRRLRSRRAYGRRLSRDDRAPCQWNETRNTRH